MVLIRVVFNLFMFFTDGKSFTYKTKDDDIVYYDCESNDSSILVDSASFVGVSDYITTNDIIIQLYTYLYMCILKFK